MRPLMVVAPTPAFDRPRASFRPVNQCSLRHSFRNLPLKDSR